MSKFQNSLHNESSPYLLQHAHNPVDWLPWSKEAFAQAERENKLVLVSIGYSACHWCHVMEHESFEDEAVAQLMNQHFVCIKVDREEHPDVDMVYMNAVQLMTQRGGWPLNCFTLPDGRPIYGGTYFPKDQFVQILQNLVHLITHKKDEVYEYASRLTDGIKQSELVESVHEVPRFERSKLQQLVQQWSHSFDLEEGGNARAPKFPLPSNLEFLLRYSLSEQDETAYTHVMNTLQKMAYGGIYDQLAGGFARYSVDHYWKVPHFEKMLYDNAQLMGMYAKAYQCAPNTLFKQVIEDTYQWMDSEMTSPYGSLYSALDADSDGEEGFYYTWTMEELKEVLGADYAFAAEIYHFDELAYWEETEKYILLRSQSDETLASLVNMPLDTFTENKKRVQSKLLERRGLRNRPGCDDKSLTAWNSMAITGLCDAYEAILERKYLLKAREIAQWIQRFQLQEDNSLKRNFKNGKAKIAGVLEDYCFAIQAYLKLYRCTFERSYLEQAQLWMDYCRVNFQDEGTKLFYYTTLEQTWLARKMELNDNVIPATNSVMARNLFELSVLLERDDYRKEAEQMLSGVYDGMEQYGSAYSNWGMLLLSFVDRSLHLKMPIDAELEKLLPHYIPDLFISENVSLPTYLLCYDQTCEAPKANLSDAVQRIVELQNKSPKRS